MRSVLGLALILTLHGAETAHAQDAMCEPINRIIASSSTHFSNLLGPPVVIDGEALPNLYHALVSLPGAENCTVLNYGTGGLYDCEYSTAAGNESALAESLVRRASLCLNPPPTIEPKITSRGWQFQVATANVSAGSAFDEQVVFHVARPN